MTNPDLGVALRQANADNALRSAALLAKEVEDGLYGLARQAPEPGDAEPIAAQGLDDMSSLMELLQNFGDSTTGHTEFLTGQGVHRTTTVSGIDEEAAKHFTQIGQVVGEELGR